MKRFTGTLLAVVLCATVTLVTSSVQASVITSGVTLNWDPNLDINGNTVLNSSLNRDDSQQFAFSGATATDFKIAQVMANDKNLPGVGRVL